MSGAVKAAQVVEVEGRRIRITTPERVLYPSAGFTKADLFAYTVAAAPALLPHVRGRPMSLRRFPEGVAGHAWYQTQCRGRPGWLRSCVLTVPGGEPQEYCVIDDLPGLLWTANLSTIELHPLLMTADDPERPTMVVFDLDPGPPANVVDAAAVSLVLRDALERLGLAAFVKTSGVKGMHVAVPLEGRATFEATKRFARTIASMLARTWPERVVDRQRRDVRAGRVLVDWLQNDHRRSTVAAYSLRAAALPQVSTPLAWDEVAEAVSGGDPRSLTFAPEQVLARLGANHDPWEGFGRRAVPLPELDRP